LRCARCSPRKHRRAQWFDDPSTLVRKYADCKKLGTHGVAFWTADMPDYTTDEGPAMWKAVDQGFPPGPDAPAPR
jgi:hypothetical protein